MVGGTSGNFNNRVSDVEARNDISLETRRTCDKSSALFGTEKDAEEKRG